jgi:hypothetical protein
MLPFVILCILLDAVQRVWVEWVELAIWIWEKITLTLKRRLGR